MSKLDDIFTADMKSFWADYNRHTMINPGKPFITDSFKHTNAKKEIKDLFLELIDNTMLYSGGMPDASINLTQIRQKVEEL